jgi:hypothetical protein
MPINKTATDGLLHVLSFLHPEYSGLISYLENHEDALVAVGPVIQAAATEGPGALAAAEKAAPDLARAITDFVAAAPIGTVTPAVARAHAENVARQIVGAPKMTPEQEQSYIDRATPNPDIG